MNAEQLYLRAVRVLFEAAEKPVSFAAALRYAALTARRLGKTREGRDYLMALQIATEDAKRIYMAKRSNDMSESKSNAARHGLTVGNMVGILGPTAPFLWGKGNDSYIGRIGRIKAFGSGVNEGQCAVFVNGEHWWFPESSLCKISRRGCFRHKKPRRRTANAKHEASGGTSGAIRLDFSAPPSGWHETTVGAGAGSEPQPEAPKAEPKFKIGDRVEACAGSAAGTTGKVIYVSWQGDMLGVVSDAEDNFFWLSSSYFRHAPAEPSPATESAQEPEKSQFKPFDRVLVRDCAAETWKPALYAYYNERIYSPYVMTSSACWRYCIPYEGNEALAGTTNDPEKG